MMGIEVRQFYRCECDRCGRRQEQGHATAEKARHAAIEEGFALSDWLHEGKCPRSTVFCKECVEQLLAAEARQAEREPMRIPPRPSML